MMTMKGLLKDKTKVVAFAFCSLAFIMGIICSERAKATSKTDHDDSGIIDTIPAFRFFPAPDSTISALPFINDSLCVIKDPEKSMSSFINELIDLFNGKDTVVNIVHLGDSHIQAGFLSGRIMRLLHNSFGNAGRGWIAPFKLSKVNEPNDYFISSNIKEWISGRCVQSNPKCPWGIGGIGIQTEAKDVNFNLIITPNNGAGYSFNKVLLYRDNGALPMIPKFEDKDSVAELSWGRQAFEKIAIDTFVTKNLIDTFTIRSANVIMDSTSTKKSNLYYGFMLMNGSPGILYHSIGVNGARFVDYTSNEYVRRLSLLKPSLIIISLGTNESYGRNFSKSTFEEQIDALISIIREEIPGVSLLITTPAESFKRTYQNKKRIYVRNENITKVADVISSYTEKNGIACWDLFKVSGGNNSCHKWYNAKMFGRDRIHFSITGYEEQGALLYKALMRACTGSEQEIAAHSDVKQEKEQQDVE